MGVKSSVSWKCSETLLPPIETLRRVVTMFQKFSAARALASSPDTSAMRARPTSFGICVLACRPVSSSRPAASGSATARYEAVRHREVTLVARQGVQVGVGLAHAAELRLEHELERVVVDSGGETLPPLGEAEDHVEGARRAGEAVRVDQPRVDLVQVVPGRPVRATERAGADACRDLVPEVGRAGMPST
jgi:hypothetical protein